MESQTHLPNSKPLFHWEDLGKSHLSGILKNWQDFGETIKSKIDHATVHSAPRPWVVGLVAQSCLTLATPWAVAYQAPLSVGFSRLECWSGLPFPPPGDLPRPGIKPRLLHWQTDALPVSHLGLKKGENVCPPSSAVSQNIWKANASWRL